MARPDIGGLLARIDRPTGWMYTDTGQWARGDGRIPNYNADFNRYRTGLSGVGLEDLRFLTARPIEVGGERSVLLTFGREEGSYRYPTIMEGWEDYTTWYWFVVRPGRVARMLPQEAAVNEAFAVDLQPSLCGLANNAFGDPLSLSRIADGVVANSVDDASGGCHSGLSFRVFPVEVDGTRSVRFYAFQNYDTPLWGTHLRQGFMWPGLRWPSERDPAAFDRWYYEVPFAAFERFVKGASMGVTPESEARDDRQGASPASQTPGVSHLEPVSSPDVQPELIGGLAGLQDRLLYPESARVDGVEGQVVVQFVVDRRGDATDLKVVRSPDDRLSEAAKQVVRESRFTPGQKGGRPVPVRFAVPVTFRIR